MKFRNILPVVLFLFFSMSGFGQTDSLRSKSIVSSNLRLSYNSSLIYPGIRAGIEIPVNSIYLIRSNKAGSVKSVLKDRFITVNSAWYHHPGFHDNLYITAEWTLRRTNSGGFFSDFSFGPGYSRTFLGGTTYRVDNNGLLNIVRSAGYNYAVIIAGGSLGFDLSVKKKIPLSLFLKFDFLTMFPYNSTFYFRPVIETGLIYKPGNFIRVLKKGKVVKK